MNTLNLTDGIGISTISTTGAYLSNNTVTDWVTPNSPYSPFTVPSTGTIMSNGTITLNSNNMNKVQQHKVAVFKITRNEDNEITDAEFLKERWIKTKGTSVEFEVARDIDLSKYGASDLAIKIIHTLTF